MRRWRRRSAFGAAAVGGLALAGCDLGTARVDLPNGWEENGYGDLAEVVLAGDLDGDGDTDLVSAGDYTYSILVNDGAGGFTQGATGQWIGRYAWRNGTSLADVDGDGDLDLVGGRVDGWDGVQYVEVFLNDGDGTLGEPQPVPHGQLGTSGAVGTAQVDGDGVADPVYAGDGRLTWWTGLGWVAESSAAIGPSPTAADLDGDGRDEMITVAGGDGDINGVTVWRNTTATSSAPAFTRGVTVLVDGPGGGDPVPTLATGDVDGDGALDVVAGTAGRLRTLLGDGDGGLAAPVDSPLGDDAAGPLALGDVDGDGVLDVVASDRTATGQAYVLFGTGDGTFTDRHDLRLPDGTPPGQPPAVADLAGDGRADVAVPTGRTISVFANALTGRTHP